MQDAAPAKGGVSRGTSIGRDRAHYPTIVANLSSPPNDLLPPNLFDSAGFKMGWHRTRRGLSPWEALADVRRIMVGLDFTAADRRQYLQHVGQGAMAFIASQRDRQAAT